MIMKMNQKACWWIQSFTNVWDEQIKRRKEANHFKQKYFHLFFMVSTVSHIILLSNNPIYTQYTYYTFILFFFIIINLVELFNKNNSVVVHACTNVNYKGRGR